MKSSVNKKLSFDSTFQYVRSSSDKDIKIEERIVLSRWVRMYLFFLLALFRIGIDLDTGIIVSCGKKIKADIHINDIQFGLLNSVLTFGKFVALLFLMIIINKNKRQLFLIMNCFLNGLSLLGFYASDNFYYICLLRIFGAFNRVFIDVYIPVWTDQYGIKKFKTTFLSIHLIIESYGKVIGAFMGTNLFENDWKKSLAVSGLFFFALGVLFFFIPSYYFTTKYVLAEKFEKPKNEKNTTSKGKNKSDEKMNENLLDKSDKNKDSENEISTFKKIITLFCTGSYIFPSLARCFAFFIQKLLHTFIKHFSLDCLGYKEEKTFIYYYTLVLVVAPLIGSIIGNFLSKCAGGYESRNSVWLVFIVGFLSLISIILASNVTSFIFLVIYLFGYFLTVSAYLPTLSGYVLCSLDKEMKGLGSSIDRLLAVFGKLIGPITYGILNEKFGKTDIFFAWNKSLKVYYLCFGFAVLGCISKYKNDTQKIKGDEKDKLESNEEKENESSENDFELEEKEDTEFLNRRKDSDKS